MTTVAGLEANTLADGFFDVVTWLVVLAASVVTVHLWRRGDLAPGRSGHLGVLLAGWGALQPGRGMVAVGAWLAQRRGRAPDS